MTGADGRSGTGPTSGAGAAAGDDDVRAALERHLRRLDADGLAAFVADLWAARGFETTREAATNRVVARRDGGTAIVEVVPGSRLGRRVDRLVPSWGAVTAGDGGVGAETDAGADVVVSPGGDRRVDRAAVAGVRVVDAADLLGMLRYAVDREAAATVCERHLGGELAALRPSPRVRARRRLRSAARRGRDLAGRSPVAPSTVAVVVVLLAVAGGAVAGLDTGFGAGAGDPGTEGATGADDAVDTASAGGFGAASEGGSTDTPDGDRLANRSADGVAAVPGLSADGIDDLGALADAHERALANESFVVWLDVYRPPAGDLGGPRTQRDIDVAVDGERYLLDESAEADGERRPVETVYHDGTDWFLAEYPDPDDGSATATADGTTATPGTPDRTRNPAASGAPTPAVRNVTYRRIAAEAAGGPGPTPPEPSTFRSFLVRRYLATPQTSVAGTVTRDLRTLYQVVGEGEPRTSGGIESYRFVALVDEEGLVREARVEYTADTVEGPLSVTLEWTYGNVGTATVDPPPWYDTEFGSDTVTWVGVPSAVTTPSNPTASATTP